MKRILFLISTLYLILVIVAGVFTLSADHLILSKGFDKCIRTDYGAYLIEQSKNSSVIYGGDTKANINDIVVMSTKEKNFKAVDAVYEDAFYLLAKTSKGYIITKLDNSLKEISESELFVVDDGYGAKVINIYENIAYVTAIDQESFNAIVYSYDLTNLRNMYLTEETEEEEDPGMLDSIHTYQSTSGKIENIAYDGSTVIINQKEDPAQKEYMDRYIESMNLTAGQSFKVNSAIAIIYLAIAIFGVIVILIVANLISLKRRFINRMLFNLLFALCAFGVMAVLTGSVVVPAIWTLVFAVFATVEILLENRDIMTICRDMKRISNENFEIKRPVGNFNETQVLWRGINELKYQFERFRYINDTSTAAAVKFLPGNMTKLFGKQSLEEIKSGAHTVFDGMVMLLRTKLNITEDIVEELEAYEREADASMLFGESKSSGIKILFNENNGDYVKQGIDMGNSVSDDDFCALYFDDSIRVDVTGTATRTVLSVDSPLMEKMEELCSWFVKMNLNMVLTEEVKDKLNFPIEVRYIGYIEADGIKKNFYEVLSVYRDSVRTDRIKCRKDFDEALSMFYRNDYYLARTAFSEILKIDETDELSRWYLFMCEKHLNNTDSINKSCALMS